MSQVESIRNSPEHLPSDRDRRYYLLDFWRGIACLMVIVFHASFYATRNPEVPLNGHLLAWIASQTVKLFAGVPIFFVISGYCITAACDAARWKPNSVQQFFLRRFRRIFPPYWILLAASAVVIATISWLGFPNLFCDVVYPLPQVSSLTVSQWIGNITLTETWRPILFHDRNGLFLTHAWTLCYEEQFYAMCGIALFLSRHHFFLTITGITAAVALFLAAVFLGIATPLPGFFFDGHWLIFAAGVLIYYRLHHASGARGVWLDVCLVAAVIETFILHHTCGDVMFDQWWWGFAFALLIRILYRWDLRIASSIWTRPVALCGVMCYSLYLVHWPIVKGLSHLLFLGGLKNPWIAFTVTVPLCIFVSILVAWIFHVFVERKFLNSVPRLLVPAQSQPLARPVTAPVGRNFFPNLFSAG